MNLLNKHSATIKHYVESFVNGRAVKTLVNTYKINCTIMPTSTSEQAAESAKTILNEQKAKRIYDYKVVYTRAKLDYTDIIIDNERKEFKILRIYVYNSLSMIANHYKYLVGRDKN